MGAATAAPRGRDRRQKIVPLFAPERRSGFDRRREYPLTGPLRDRPLALIVLLAAVNTLSLLDFQLTAYELAQGIATEGNPVMAFLFASGPNSAWLFKTVLVLLVSVGIWRGRRMRPVLGVALFAFLVFSGVLAYHFVGVGAAYAL